MCAWQEFTELEGTQRLKKGLPRGDEAGASGFWLQLALIWIWPNSQSNYPGLGPGRGGCGRLCVLLGRPSSPDLALGGARVPGLGDSPTAPELVVLYLKPRTLSQIPNTP